MTTSYYPGCTLPQKARDFDVSARTCCRLLDIELAEMEKWVCCGSAFKLDRQNVMQHLAPIRNLIGAREKGDRLMTLCAFCYNSLKRANCLVRNDPDKLAIVTEFLDKPYDGQLRVLHLLEILRDEVTFDAIRAKITRPLSGLKVAAYYGCLLLRPKDEVAFDSPEDPSVLEDLFAAAGAQPVSYNQRTECCGSYLSLKDPAHTSRCVERVLSSARTAGANVIVTTCPMCNFNFEYYGAPAGGDDLHVVYFTELLAFALGAEPAQCGLDQHTTDVRGFLQATCRRADGGRSEGQA